MDDHTEFKFLIVRAFLEEDYHACVELVSQLYPDTSVFDLQALLISLQRTGRVTEIAQFTHALSDSVTFDAWERAVLGLTLSSVPADEVFVLADTVDRQSKTHYYSAQHHLTNGRADEAVSELELADALGSSCLEAAMAKQVLRWIEESGRHHFCARIIVRSRLNEARALRRAGDVQGLIAALDRLTEPLPEMVPTTNPLSLEALQFASAVLREVGALGKAAPLFATFVSALRETVGADSELFEEALYDHGSCVMQLGNYAEAARILGELVTLRSKRLGPNDPSSLEARYTLATAHAEDRSYTEAKFLFEQLVEAQRNQCTALHAHSLNAFGGLLVYTEDYERAARYLDAAAEMYGQLGDRYRVRVVHHNRAALFAAQGQLSEAIDALASVRDLRDTDEPPTPQDVASLSTLAAYMIKAGRVGEALPAAKEAVAAASRLWPEGHPKSEGAFQAFYTASVMTGDTEVALDAIESTMAIEDRRLLQAVTGGTARSQARHLTAMRRSAECMLSVVVSHAKSAPDAAMLIWTILIRRKGLDALLARMKRVGRSQAQASELAELQSVSDELRDLELSGFGMDASMEDFVRTTMALRERRERLERTLLRRVGAANLAETRSARSVRESMPEGIVLFDIGHYRFIDFSQSPPALTDKMRYVGVIVTTGARSRMEFVDLGPAAPIDANIDAYRWAIGADDRRGDSATGDAARIDPSEPIEVIGRRLTQALLSRVLTEIRDDVTLVVVPDGKVSMLPLGMLPLGDGSLLMDSATVSYLANSIELRAAGIPRTPQSAAIVVAAPDYDLEAQHHAVDSECASDEPGVDRQELARALDTGHFSPLPGTLEEGKRVAQELGVDLLHGSGARKRSVLGSR